MAQVIPFGLKGKINLPAGQKVTLVHNLGVEIEYVTLRVPNASFTLYPGNGFNLDPLFPNTQIIIDSIDPSVSYTDARFSVFGWADPEPVQTLNSLIR